MPFLVPRNRSPIPVRNALRMEAHRPLATLIERFRRPSLHIQRNDLRGTPICSVRPQYGIGSRDLLALNTDDAPDRAPPWEADRYREAPRGLLADRDGAVGLGRNQWHERLEREVGARPLQRPALGIPPVNARRFQQAVPFAQADPVLPPSGQDPDHVLGQVSGIAHYHAQGDCAANGLFDQVHGQRQIGPQRRMPRLKLRILQQHRVDLLMQAIAGLFLARAGEICQVLGHRGLPLGECLIPAIETQAQGEADRPTHIQAGDRVMGQGLGAITVVVVAVHMVK